MRRRITHRNEVYGGRWLSITIAMPLDPAISFAMVGFFFEDWLPHEYYSYACIWILSAWARKKSQKNREGNRRRHLKKTVLNCSNAYMRMLVPVLEKSQFRKYFGKWHQFREMFVHTQKYV